MKILQTSSLQQQYWLDESLNSTKFANNQTVILQTNDSFDYVHFQHVLTLVLRANPLLISNVTANGTELIFNNTELLEKILNYEKLDVTIEDYISSFLPDVIRKKFILDEEAPIRCLAIETLEGTIIVLVMHSVGFDSSAKIKLVQQLIHAYNSQGSINHITDSINIEEIEKHHDEIQQRLSSENDVKDTFWKPYLANSEATTLKDALKDDEYQHTNYKSIAIDSSYLDALFKNNASESYQDRELILLTILSILISKYSSQKDITIGFPIDCSIEQDFCILGCFQNYLPLRIIHHSENSFSEIYGQIKQNIFNISKNDNVTIGSLIQHLSIEHNGIDNPLFRISVEFTDKLEVNDTTFKEILIPKQDVHLELEFNFIKSSSEFLELHVRYDYNKFSSAYVEGILDCFCNILQQVSTSNDIKFSSINLLTTDQIQALCVDENSKTIVELEYTDILKPIETFSLSNGQKTAVRYKDKCITYDELINSSTKFAHYLIDNGVKAGDIVGISVARNIDMFVILLGILKSGAAYLPLDPDYPIERLEYMQEDASVKFIVTDNTTKKLFSNGETQIVYEDIKRQLLHTESVKPLISINSSLNAYVIYTSGSTGRPKGVQISHLAMSNLCQSMIKEPGICPDDVIIATTSLSFDISIVEIFYSLAAGATVIIVDRDTAKNGEALSNIINDSGVNFMQATPTTWRILLASGWSCSKDFKILSGGEALPEDLAKQLLLMSDNVWNMYGPTETTIWSTAHKMAADDAIVHVGKPIWNTSLYVLDLDMNPVPIGLTGEVYIGGKGLSAGYLNRPELTSEKFLHNPFNDPEFPIIYKSGDLGRFLPDGNLEIIDRVDFQVKIRGYRIELGEIENAIKSYPSISNCVVSVSRDDNGIPTLIANYICVGTEPIQETVIKKYLGKTLPDYMIPDFFRKMESFPTTPNGKTDRKAISKIKLLKENKKQKSIKPRNDLEKSLLKIWGQILVLNDISISDNFFDIGGNSLKGMLLVQEIKTQIDSEFSIVNLFEYSSITSQADFISKKIANYDSPSSASQSRRESSQVNEDIAIIGMAVNLPGANSLDEFWNNLCNDVESITHFTHEELAPFIEPELLNDPNYTPYRGIIDDIEMFDASFFGINPTEAKTMDPQQRVFLQLAWHALEDAGIVPEGFDSNIGVFANVGDNHYYTENVLVHQDVMNMVGKIIVEYGNMKDYIANRVNYHLNLTGPGLNINSACSGALAVMDVASNSLNNMDCDVAIAGGIDITIPQKSGFLHQPNGPFCKDGHCKPFDDSATGTMFCDGAGIVVLKRVSDAIRDNDRIYAVIKSVAVNNDGSSKVGFTAPSVEGQAQVIRKAHQKGNIDPNDISYIEAHGTGTPIGDPIEIEGLRRAFYSGGAKRDQQYCYLGSVKGHIGHPTNAAGTVSVIKTALSLYYEQIPSTLHFNKPNQKIDFATTPFKVVNKLTQWKRTDKPRIAGVSSFGFGGTNVHAVLGEAPERLSSSSGTRPNVLLPISAKNKKSLDSMTMNLASFVKDTSESLEDISYTLQTSRATFAHRRFVVADSTENCISRLQSLHPNYSQTTVYQEGGPPPIVFMYPGQGAQYIGMGLSLYNSEPVFKDTVNQCAEILKPHLGKDIRDILYSSTKSEEEQYNALKNTYFTQPAIFVIEYALTQLLMSWGIKPAALIGHSVGEFTSAAISGLLSLEDALKLIALRGKLISELPGGSMLSVRSSASELEPLLPEDVQLAASNGPSLSVIAGPHDSVLRLSNELESKGYQTKELHTSHAFHSAMMQPAVEPFIKEVKKATFAKPKIPFFSTLNVDWLSDENYSDADYWGCHMRSPVRFSEAISKLTAEDTKTIFLEIGPRNTLTTLARQSNSQGHQHVFINCLSDSPSDEIEHSCLIKMLGSVWCHGVEIDWHNYYSTELRNKVSIPYYAFNKNRYWLEPVDKRHINNYDDYKHIVKNEDKTNLETDGQEQADFSTDGFTDKLRNLISDLYGQEIDQYDDTITFMEMGMDSLFLTQLAYVVKQKFDLNITFSNLMNEFPNIQLLSEKLIQSASQENIISRSNKGDAEADVIETKLCETTPPVLEPKLEKLLKSTSYSNDDIDRIIKLIKERRKWTLPFSTRPAAQAIVGRDALGEPGWFIKEGEGTYAKLEVNEDNEITTKLSISYNPTFHGDIETILPLTEEQVEMWLSCKLGGDDASRAYNESMTITLTGHVNINFLKKAINETIARHEMLRACISPSGKYVIVNNEPFVEIDYKMLDELTAENANKALTELEDKQALTVFNLEFGPLIRFVIAKLPEDKVAIIICAHHLVCDGWSMDVVLSDLAKLYTTLMSEQPLENTTPTQFSQYIKILHTEEYIGAKEQALNYWKKHFASTPVSLDLPLDYNRPNTRTFDCGSTSTLISQDITNELEKLARSLSTSKYVLLLSIFYVLIKRISNQEDIVLGVPVAGHPNYGCNDMVGHAVSMMPLRCNLSDCDEIREICEMTQKSLSDAHNHHQVSFGSIINEINIAREPNRPPLISVGVTSSQMYKEGELKFATHAIDYNINHRKFETFDMYFNLREHINSTEVFCHFNSQLFDIGTVERILQRYEILINKLTSQHDQKLSHIDLLTAQEHALYSELNSTATPIPDKFLHELFEETALDYPDRVAIEFNEVTVTYKQLNDYSNQLAKILTDKGARPGEFIAIILDRTINSIVSALAVLKSGAAFLPIDPTFPVNRINYMLEDSQANYVITTRDFKALIHNQELILINLSEIEFDSESKDSELMQHEYSKSESAYLLYTSGTTGKPKGVQIPHVAIVNFLTSMKSIFELNSDDNILGITTFSFDISILEIFLPIISGSRLVLASKSEAISGEKLGQIIKDKHITFLQGTPTTWRLILEEEGIDLSNITALVGGENLPDELKQQLFTRVKVLWNMYGPTETTIWSSCFKFEDFGDEVQLGRPIDNTSFIILDKDGCETPLGTPGELYIGGAGLSIGYLNQKELTQQAFIKSKSGQRIYATGDIVKLTRDGKLLFIGRKGKQVKIRGYRIELGEIESVLQTHEDILEVCCMVYGDTESSKQIISLYRANSEIATNELRDLLSVNVPAYMLPSRYLYVDEFPKTPNNKIDRKKLSNLVDELIDSEVIECQDSKLTELDTEAKLAMLWKDVFKLPDINYNENFFSIGGHSLLAVELMGKIEQEFDLKLPVSTLFTHPTIKSLSEKISENSTLDNEIKSSSNPWYKFW
jgi:amino acid adenylation domain-containing protein